MSQQSKTSKETSFFQRILDTLFKSSDPEVEKRRLMRNIEKELSKTKFKFYKAKGDEVLPAFAKTFFAFYKVISPAQIFFQNYQNDKALQAFVMNSVLSNKQIELIDSLSEESISAEANTIPLQQLNAKIKNRIEQLCIDFDSNLINKIDTIYTQLILFKSFCSYDYFFLLRKFTSLIREYDFSSIPNFEAINGKYIVDDLKDFISIAWDLTQYDNWTDMFQLLKKLKDPEPVSQSTWLKMLSRIREIQKSRVFEMMLQLIQEDTSFEFSPKEGLEHIAESYLDKIRRETEKTLGQLQLAQKTSKIDSLVSSIFGTTSVIRMKNYTEDQSNVFEKRNIGAFSYHQPMNYMKAFILDYIKKDGRELADLILVRGKWSTSTLSTAMSESYHSLLELSDKIIEFDETLSDSSPLTNKLRTLLGRCERDKEAMNVLHTVLGDINNEAKNLLVSGSQNIIVFAKNIKMILEDHQKPHPELIINWKELDHFSEKPLKEMGVSVYKQLYQFVTLMQSFLN